MLIASSQNTLIIGGGVTGLSVARFLQRHQRSFYVFDTRNQADILTPFYDYVDPSHCFCAQLDYSLLDNIDEVVISPGVNRRVPVVVEALKRNIPVVGDISLFLRHAVAPVVGITGSNGKSTVTTMVAEAAQGDGINVAVGGNLGRPALDLLDQDVELYVLELSSFQLESTAQAGLAVAAHLNLSEDHLDRHGNMLAYFGAKQKIFHGAAKVIYKLNDSLTQPPLVAGVERRGFGLQRKIESSEQQYWYDLDSADLCVDDSVLMSRQSIKQKGLHNLENILAVFAIADAAGISRNAVIELASNFDGLAHRCELVAQVNGISFINDSKATNEGACIAALEGLAPEFSKIMLIAGGQAKGADFSKLIPALVKHVHSLYLIGEDAAYIASKLNGKIPVQQYDSMLNAVAAAFEHANSGALILLSPACASFDMFSGFEQRGQCFIDAVSEVAK